MKLISITFQNAPRIPGIRPGDMSTINCDRPDGAMRGWRVAIRGGTIFFISPYGWVNGQSFMQWDRTKPQVIHEVPRSECYLQWSGDVGEIESVLKTKYDSEPFGEPFESIVVEKPTTLLSQLDPSQMGDA